MSKVHIFNKHYTPLRENEITLQIEGLVKDVINHYKPIKLSRFGRISHIKFDGSFYLKILQALPTYLSIYNPPSIDQKPMHDYSEHLEIFWRACEETGLVAIKYKRYHFEILTMNRIITLVELISQYANSPTFKRRVYDRFYETKDKRTNLQKFARSMHARFSRLLVVRVDFGYLKDCRHLVGIDDVYGHLSAFKRKKETDSLLMDCVAGALVIEQGAIHGGFHIHAVFYFLGNDHQKDWHIAEEIGEIWKKVTNGLGSFYNVHDDKDKFIQRGTLGIGMINRNDRIAVENSIKTVTYLAKPEKDDQYLRIKPHRARTFTTWMSKKNKRRKHTRAAH